MAALTWREVSAPNFSGVGESQRAAAALLANGFDGLRGALSDMKKNQMQTGSNELLSRVSQYTDAAALGEAQRSGALYQGLDLSKITPDAIQYAAEHQNRLLRNDEQGLVNQGRGIANNTNQFALTTTQRDDQQAQARLAAQGPAADLLAQARTLAGSGDAAKVEEARGLLAKNTQTLVAAGYKADAIPGLLDAERGAGTAGFGYKQEVLKNDKFWEAQGVSEQARQFANGAINGTATPEMAVRSIQENSEIKDPRIKAQAIQVIEAAKDANVWATPNQADQLASSLGIQVGGVPQQPVTPRQTVAGNPVEDVVNRIIGVESGGNANAKNPLSSASGLGQFTDGTWIATVRKHRPDMANMSNQELLQLKTDPNLGRQMTTALTQDNARMIDAAGAPVTRGNLYLAHFAGEGGFRAINRASNDAALVDVLGPGAINANPFLKGKTVGWIKNWAETKMGGDGSSAGDIANSRIDSAFAGTPAPAISMQVGGGASEAAKLAQTVTQSQAPAGAGVTPAPVNTAPAPAVSEADRLAAEALAAARTQRAQDTGMAPAGEVLPGSLMGLAVAGPAGAQSEAAALAQQVVPAATSAAPVAATPIEQTAPISGTPAPVTATSPSQTAQTLADQAVIDQALNPDAPLINMIQQAQTSTAPIGQVVKGLIGEGGALQGMNEQAALAAINETIKMSGGKLKPAAAAALVAQNPESRDLQAIIDKVPIIGSIIPDNWFSGDRFGGGDNGGTSATRINMEGVRADLSKIGMNVDGSIDISRGVSGIQNQRTASVSAQQIGAVQAQVLSLSVQAQQIQSAIQRGQDTPANRQALAQIMQQIQQFNTWLNRVGAEPGSPTTIFTGAGEGRPAR